VKGDVVIKPKAAKETLNKSEQESPVSQTGDFGLSLKGYVEMVKQRREMDIHL
jgi:hypothetical protein